MERTQIVFLVGCAGSGKDTVGKCFKEMGFTRVSFGDTLKKEYALQNGIDVSILHEQGPLKEFHRPGLIKLAEDARAIDELIWVNKAFKPHLEPEGRFHNQFKEGLKLVVTDARRIGDIEWAFRAKENPLLDIKLFIVNRPGIIDNDALTHEAIGYAKGLHRIVSADFPFIDGVIENDKTVEALAAKVKWIAKLYNFLPAPHIY